MTKETFNKAMSSIYNWSVIDGKIDPPNSELPECIKERVRWIYGLTRSDYIPGISFTGEIESVLPDPDEEEDLKKDWESGSSADWFPISDEYKMFYKENRAYFSFTIPAAVAIELLFGLNDTNCAVSARQKEKVRPISADMSLNIKAYFKIPKSYSKKRKEKCLNGEERPNKKPDSDNIAKIVLDGLNPKMKLNHALHRAENVQEGLYLDDKQVVSLSVEKWYAEEPRVVITAVWHDDD